MYGDLARIFEIRDCSLEDGRSGTFFDNFDSYLAGPVTRKQIEHIEAELAGLDAVAWIHLKSQVVPLFQKRHEKRGWQAAFDKLNEAKAYNYLAKIGCTELAFIPVSSKPGQKTPDLQGKQGNNPILCEVKTINPSDEDAAARSAVAAGNIASGCTENTLRDAFFAKLANTLKAAATQMTSYCADGAIQRYVYVSLNFDDQLHEYVDDYLRQIESFVTCAHDLPTIEVIFDAKPAFYSATPKSSSSRLFMCRSDRHWEAQ